MNRGYGFFLIAAKYYKQVMQHLKLVVLDFLPELNLAKQDVLI